MNAMLCVLSIMLILLVLPGTVYLGLMTFYGSRKQVFPYSRPMSGRLAIVVPAHNEVAGIARTLKNLLALAAADEDTVVVVVADNCTDHTAQIAAVCGARVLVRQNDALRGKGYALDFAFQALMKENFTAFVVVDADSKASPNFIPVLRQHFGRGALAVQVRYTVLNAEASTRTRLSALALLAFNVLRPRARHTLGFSAGIFGNGFALHRRALNMVPYVATSVVEDLEYHLNLIKAGVRVHFADDTSIRGDMPTTGRGAETQRARWEGGRLRMLLDHGFPLLKEVFKGQWHLLEPLADLMLAPLAYHVLFLLLLCAMPLWFAQCLGVAGLLVVMLHVLVAANIGRMPMSQLAALMVRVPLYLFWKINRVSSILRTARRGSAWVRTDRNTSLKEAK